VRTKTRAVWLLGGAAALGAVAALGAAPGCATGHSADDDAAPPDARPPAPDAGSPIVASTCPPGQFATGLDQGGALTCASIDPAALAAVAESCSIYLGWRDECDGCSTPPSKWGHAGASCTSSAGADSGCRSVTLGGTDLELFALGTDGDVNDDDKFYLGWQCTPPEDARVPGPCPEGTYLAAVTPGGLECASAGGAIAEYARSGCQVYAGWRDKCGSCTTPPSKWGHAGGDVCAVGLGVNGTCAEYTLGDRAVRTFGLNTDGDVDENDKFYLGFQCSGAAPAEEVAPASCPAGQLVVAIESDGRVRCASPLPEAEAAIQAGCRLYAGWRDNCSGCQLAPSKWGLVGHAACEAGAGADSTCGMTALGDATMPLFGLSPDGDVDGNDTFYVGFRCR